MIATKSIGVPGAVLITLALALSGFIAFLFTTERGRHIRHDLAERTTALATSARRAMPHPREVASEGSGQVASMHDAIQH